MDNSKVVKIIKSFSKEEFKYLGWFVKSNYFNTDANLLRLYEAMSKYYPDFDSKQLAKELLFEKVYSGQTYHDGKWRNLVLKMNKLLEDYLVLLELEHQKTARQQLLTAAFGRHDLYEQFEKSSFELSDQLGVQSEQSADALRERTLVNLRYYHHAQTNKVQHWERLQTAIDDLDHYYFAEKLRLASDLKVFENMVTGAEAMRLRSEIQTLVSQGGIRNLPYLEMYDRLLHQLERLEGLGQFKETVAFFAGIAGRLAMDDKQFGLLHLLNFAINQANKGEGEYFTVVLELYKLGLEQKILVQDGSISDNTYINIVSTGSKLKQFEWTSNFIQAYEHCLPAESRKDTKILSLGLWYFHQREFSQVVTLLLNCSFQGVNENLSSKSLLLRCYFELCLIDSTYYSLFTSYSSAFEKYVRREKQLSVNRKIWYKNFIFMLLKITKIKLESKWDKSTREKIENEISLKPMVLKSWLLERLDKMRTGNPC